MSRSPRREIKARCEIIQFPTTQTARGAGAGRGRRKSKRWNNCRARAALDWARFAQLRGALYYSFPKTDASPNRVRSTRRKRGASSSREQNQEDIHFVTRRAVNGGNRWHGERFTTRGNFVIAPYRYELSPPAPSPPLLPPFPRFNKLIEPKTSQSRAQSPRYMVEQYSSAPS